MVGDKASQSVPLNVLEGMEMDASGTDDAGFELPLGYEERRNRICIELKGRLTEGRVKYGVVTNYGELMDLVGRAT